MLVFFRINNFVDYRDQEMYSFVLHLCNSYIIFVRPFGISRYVKTRSVFFSSREIE